MAGTKRKIERSLENHPGSVLTWCAARNVDVSNQFCRANGDPHTQDLDMDVQKDTDMDNATAAGGPSRRGGGLTRRQLLAGGGAAGGGGGGRAAGAGAAPRASLRGPRA